jgi:hypothetical protein
MPWRQESDACFASIGANRSKAAALAPSEALPREPRKGKRCRNGFRGPVPFWKQSDGQQERLRRLTKMSAVFASLRLRKGAGWSGGVIPPKAEERLHSRFHWRTSSTNRNLRLELFKRAHSCEHRFRKTGRVRIGQIRSLLVWLIEHLSSAARISGVFLDQRR